MEISINYRGSVDDTNVLREVLDIVDEAKQISTNREYNSGELFAGVILNVYYQKADRKSNMSIGWNGSKIFINI